MKRKSLVLKITLIILMIISSISFFSNREILMQENRYAYLSKDIDVTDFTNSIENVIEDQMIFREEIIKAFKSYKYFINLNTCKVDDAIFFDKDRFLVGNQLLLDNNYYQESRLNIVKNRAYELSLVAKRFSSIKYYYYLFTRPEDILYLPSKPNFFEVYKENFLENLDPSIKYMQFTDYDNLSKFYNVTDHHLSSTGVKHAYTNIINLINEDFDIDKPKNINITQTDLKFISSKGYPIDGIYDNIYDYSLEIDNIKKYFVDGEEVDIQYDKQMRKDNFYTYSDAYSSYYGDITYKKVFETDQKDKPNILIFTDSTILNLKELLANHFNTTVIIDLRLNKNTESLNELIEHYDIDIILNCGISNVMWHNSNQMLTIDD